MGTFEQRSEGSEEASHVGIWEKSIPGRGNASAKALRRGRAHPTSEQHGEHCG